MSEWSSRRDTSRERRASPRFATLQLVEVETVAGRFVVELVNISSGGACVSMANMPVPAVGSLLTVRLVDGDHALGQLRWVGGVDVGIAFDKPLVNPVAATEFEFLGRSAFARTLRMQAKRRARKA